MCRGKMQVARAVVPEELEAIAGEVVVVAALQAKALEAGRRIYTEVMRRLAVLDGLADGL